MSAYYTNDELVEIGFCSLGKNVLISRKASIYRPESISIGDSVRIDDFCLLSAGDGGIAIGNYVHIGAYSSIIGGGAVTLEDFVNISSRVSIYSSNDDYSGETMTGPMVPSEWTNIERAAVRICRHVILGCGSVILPGVKIGEGVAVGTLSFVKQDCEAFLIYCGTPARRVGKRKSRLLELEREFMLRLLD